MTVVTTLLFILVVSFAPSVTNSAIILAYYPTPSISHQVVFRPLTNELVRRGHHVTVITADPQYPKGKTPTNLTEVDVHDLSYEIWKDRFIKTAVGIKDDMCAQNKAVFTIMLEIIEKHFQTTEVKKVIDKNSKYDLLTVEAFLRPALVLSHIFKVPLIQFSSVGLVLDNYKHLGVPQHELLHPTYFRRKLYNLTIWEKFTELYGWYKVESFIHNLETEEDLMLKRNFGVDVPPIKELANNIDMIFLNSHPVFEGVWSMPPKVIHIYGIHKKPVKELPTELKNYMDSSKNGVIYITFGTNVQPSLLPPDKIQILIKVVSELPYDVLWKWDKDVMTNKTNNIKLTKWVPQSDLLNQWFNVEQIVHHNIGLGLNMESLTEDNARNAVKTVVNDSSFRRNMAKLKSVMHDQPETPLDRAIWWTEYVLRNNGAKHLRTPAANMPWTEYFEIELVAVILAGVLSSVSIVSIVIIYLCKMMFKKKEKVKKN